MRPSTGETGVRSSGAVLGSVAVAGAESHVGLSLIAVVHSVEIRSMGTCVGNIQQHLAWQLVLEAKVPLLHVGSF